MIPLLHLFIYNGKYTVTQFDDFTYIYVTIKNMTIKYNILQDR